MPDIRGGEAGGLGDSPSAVQGQSPGRDPGGRSPPEAVRFCVYSGPKISSFATQSVL